jgi:hypothetical protein
VSDALLNGVAIAAAVLGGLVLVLYLLGPWR